MSISVSACMILLQVQVPETLQLLPLFKQQCVDAAQACLLLRHARVLKITRFLRRPNF